MLEGSDGDNFRSREWRRICNRAKVGHRAMKDLRDTFASQLFTAGVQLGYISRQLGHSEITTNARHYAKWIDTDEYREPIPLLPGEVPADLIARISGVESPRTPQAADSCEATDIENLKGGEDLRGSGGQTRTADLRLMKPPL